MDNQHAQQLENQANANKVNQEQLMQQITEKETILNELKTQLQNKSNDAVAQLEKLNQTVQQKEQQIEQINKQVAVVQAENADLIRRITVATGIINETVDKLQIMLDDTNPKEVTDAIQSIEESIENISRSIQGQPIQGQQTYGGKKTKKLRHKQKGGYIYSKKTHVSSINSKSQKGGFIYKDKTMRPVIYSSRRSSRRSSRKSKSSKRNSKSL